MRRKEDKQFAERLNWLPKERHSQKMLINKKPEFASQTIAVDAQVKKRFSVVMMKKQKLRP